MSNLYLAGEAEADALLASSPLALLIGMVLYQQVPLELAFAAPLELSRRLKRELDAGHIADRHPGRMASVFARPPALHRFPRPMSQRVHSLCRWVVEHADGQGERVWTDAADGADLLGRLSVLPGFGEQKARTFIALLGKQLAFQPVGWEQAGAPYTTLGTRMSVADIVDARSREEVRSHKRLLRGPVSVPAQADSTRPGRGQPRGARSRTA